MTSSRINAAPWWLVLFQGLLSIFIGVMLLAKPGMAVLVIVRVLGWYWLIKGIFALASIFNPEAKSHRGLLVLNGIIGVLAGFAVLDHPVISALFIPSVLVTFIGIAGVFIGANELVAAFRGAGFGMAMLGLTSIILGGLLLGNTLLSVAILVYILGFTELVGGIVAFFAAFGLRSAQKSENKTQP